LLEYEFITPITCVIVDKLKGCNLIKKKGETFMHTVKEEAINAIATLPDSATIEDIMYRLYVIDKIKRGLEAIHNGETVTLDELQREIETW